jgi:hypothetical protein
VTLPTVEPADDSLHTPPSDDPFWTEAYWFGFGNAARNISGVLYPVFRPNQGVGSLGIYLWDDRAIFERDVLYHQMYPHVPLPADPLDMTLLGGLSCRRVAPLQRYDVRYDDGVELAIELSYEGLYDPVGRGPQALVTSFNQLCHVTGFIRLNGEELAVDDYELRARAWSIRPDLRRAPVADGVGIDRRVFASDTFGASATSAFFVGTFGNGLVTTAHDGHLWRDGNLQPIVEAQRSVLSRSALGYPEGLLVEGVDAIGRAFRAVGTPKNRLFMPGNGFVVWSSGVSWMLDGELMWGKDEDVPVDRETRRFGGAAQ